MARIQSLLDTYGESHQNAVNKMIHWICVPAILFSLFGLLMAIPFFMTKSMWLNWAGIILILALLYYLRLSIPMFIGFVVIGLLALWGNYQIFQAVNYDAGDLAVISVAIFVIAWIGQFIGHKIEGKKPSFFQDLQFLLIGPAWLLHFIYRKLGIRY